MRRVRDPMRYLQSLSGLGIRTDTLPLSKVLKALHHPERDYRSVLIAGTNGKGSIAAMVSAILTEAGLKTGLYTSPHLQDYRERIRINGEMISRRELRSLIEETRRNLKEDLTYFEFSTLMAFIYFSVCRVDLAVLEVGMGGRFDATNLVTPDVSVISNVSLEHREFLGKDLAAIAREKGGIIKTGGICLTAARQKSVRDVLEGICKTRQARLYRLGRDIKARRLGDGAFAYRGIAAGYQRIEVPLRGRHQIENAALAVGVAEILAAQGLPIGDRAVTEGVKATQWAGRLEVLQKSPALVVDGAHNPAGVSALCRALAEDFSYRRLILVFGVLSDKDYGAMLKKIAPLAQRIILTRPASERAVPLSDLRARGLPYTAGSIVREDPKEALHEALRLAGEKDLVCITGSLYLVGEVRRVFQRSHRRR